MEDLVLSCLESRVEENRNLYARFLVGPFFKGDALTVATALRRVLLSSAESVAITALYIQGITHEFSTIVGVRESVLELSLNFQSIVLSYDKNFFQKKSFFQDFQIGYLQVQGPKVVYANDLKLPLGVKVVYPTQYIATVSREGILVLKFTIGKTDNRLAPNPSSHISDGNSRKQVIHHPVFGELVKNNIVKTKRRYSYKNVYLIKENLSFYPFIKKYLRTASLPWSCLLFFAQKDRLYKAKLDRYQLPYPSPYKSSYKSLICACTSTRSPLSLQYKYKSKSYNGYSTNIRSVKKKSWLSPLSRKKVPHFRFIKACNYRTSTIKNLGEQSKALFTFSNPVKGVRQGFVRRFVLVKLSKKGRKNLCESTGQDLQSKTLYNRPFQSKKSCYQSIFYNTNVPKSSSKFVLKPTYKAEKQNLVQRHEMSSRCNRKISKKILTHQFKHTFIANKRLTPIHKQIVLQKFYAYDALLDAYQDLCTKLLILPKIDCCTSINGIHERCKINAMHKRIGFDKVKFNSKGFIRHSRTSLNLFTNLRFRLIKRFGFSKTFTESLGNGKPTFCAARVQKLNSKSKTYPALATFFCRDYKYKSWSCKQDLPLRAKICKKIGSQSFIHLPLKFAPKMHSKICKKTCTWKHLKKQQKEIRRDDKVFKSDICLRNIIPLDSTLPPILRVNFVVEIDDEVLYIRQKVRERIVLEVWTNGSIHPRQAVHDATLSLLDMFSSFRSLYQENSYSFPLIRVPQYTKSLKTDSFTNRVFSTLKERP